MSFFGRVFDAMLGKSREPVLYEKSETSAWMEVNNPLRGLTVTQTQNIFDTARMGLYADLQLLYAAIEEADPILLTCLERRSTTLLSMDWTIRETTAERMRVYDKNLAAEQAKFLNYAFADAERGNLAAMLEHLALAFFRGFSHARPLYGAGMKTLEGFELFDNWNFCRDIVSGAWWWNPDATTAANESNCVEVPPGELVSVVRTRHVNYPAMEIYIRRALGDKKYGIFIERYGVPPVIIIMPPDVPKDRELEYLGAASKTALGGTGALPSGSDVKYATDARGTDPFTAFLKRQQELVVLMSTGGLFTTLEGATGIGQGASPEHAKAFRSIILRDARAVVEPINRVATAALLNAQFPGRPHLAYFDLTEPAPTTNELLDSAAKAKAAGYRVEKSWLEEQTGYTLVEDAAAAPQGPMFNREAPTGRLNMPVMNKETTAPQRDRSAVLRALRQDIAPALAKAAEVINMPAATPADFDALAARVDATKGAALPVAMETEIAAAFAEGAKKEEPPK